MEINLVMKKITKNKIKNEPLKKDKLKYDKSKHFEYNTNIIKYNHDAKYLQPITIVSNLNKYNHISCIIKSYKLNFLIIGLSDNNYSHYISFHSFNSKTKQYERKGMIKAHKLPITQLMISSINESVLLSASMDKTIHFYNINSKKQLNILKGHKSGITYISEIISKHQIISSSYDKSIIIWSFDSYEQLYCFKDNDIINKIEYNESTNQIIYLTNNIKLWDLNQSQYKINSSFFINDCENIINFTLLKSIKNIIVINRNNPIIYVYNIFNKQNIFNLEANCAIMNNFEFHSSIDNYLISLCQNKTFLIWSLENKMLITTIYIDQTYQIEALFVTKEGEIVYSENKLIYLL